MGSARTSACRQSLSGDGAEGARAAPEGLNRVTHGRAVSDNWHDNTPLTHVPAGAGLQTVRGGLPSICAMERISQPCGAAGTPLAKLLACGVAGVLACTAYLDAAASEPPADAQASRGERVTARPQPDFSGRERTGIASFYAARFAGRKMADGSRMDPNSNNAASRTLPLGTIATVTDLATQKSAVVTIQDRGPYVKGRIVDLSPFTASKIGITPRRGIARVRVTPLVVPLPDGRLRLASAGPQTQPNR